VSSAKKNEAQDYIVRRLCEEGIFRMLRLSSQALLLGADAVASWGKPGFKLAWEKFVCACEQLEAPCQ